MSNNTTKYRNNQYDSNTDTYTLQISEYIGSWYTDPQMFNWYLNRYPNVKKVVLETLSSGGDPISAISVANRLKQLQRNGVEVEGRIMGFVASAATILLVAGCGSIKMERNSMFLIHKLEAYIGWVTDAQARAQADNITKIESLIVDIYMRRTSRSEQEVRDLMSKDIWLTPDEALEWGFIDEIIDDETAQPTQYENNVSYQNYIKNGGIPVPQKILFRNKSQHSTNMSIETKQPPKETAQVTVKKSAFDNFMNSVKSLFVIDEENQDEAETTEPTTGTLQNNAAEVSTDIATEQTEEKTKVIDFQAQIDSLTNQLKNIAEENKQLKNTPAGKTFANVTKLQTPPSIQVGESVYELRMQNQNQFIEKYDQKTGKYSLSKNRIALNPIEMAYLRNHRPHLYREQMTIMRNSCPDFTDNPLSGVSLTQLETELGNLTIHVSALQEIMTHFFNLGTPSNIPNVPGGILNHTYGAIYAEVGEVMQPIRGCAFNPKGDMDFSVFKNLQRGWKIDQQFCPQNFYDGYFSYLNSNNFDPWNHPFLNWVLSQYIKAGIDDDINIARWFGEYAATGDNAVDSYDGYWTIIDNNVTASNIVPMAAFNPATDSALEYIETFVAAFPKHWLYSNKSISINVPAHIADKYLLEYREKYKAECCFMDDGGSPLQEYKVWQRPNVRIVPTLGMGTGDRLVASVDGTLYYRTGGSVNGIGSPIIERCGRSLKVMIDVVGSSMISTICPGYLLVSDQAQSTHDASEFNACGLNVTYPSLVTE